MRRLDLLPKDKQLDLVFDLINAFRIVKTPLETALLIQDLLTANEVKNLATRLRIAKYLLTGHTQRDIARSLHSSLGTVTKVQAWLNRGGEGLKKVIANLPKKYDMPKKLPPGPIEYHLPQALTALAEYILATRQEKSLEKFMEGVKDKKDLDYGLQKVFDKEFKNLKRIKINKRYRELS